MFSDAGDVPLHAADDGAMVDAADMTAPDAARDMAVDIDLAPVIDMAPMVCSTTADCAGGQECVRTDPSKPEVLQCIDVVCGCAPDAWCDGTRCWDVAPCASSDECQGGQVCLSSLVCDDLCVNNGDCGAGFDCTRINAAGVADPADEGRFTCQPARCRCEFAEDRCDRGRCVHATEQCSADTACPPPPGRYTCAMDSGTCLCTGADCERACDADSDCASFEECDIAESSCIVRRCFDDSDCPSGRVCGWVEGVGRLCSVPGPLLAGDSCDGPSDCATGFCSNGTCLQTCLGNGDCPEGTRCEGQGVETPACLSDGTCGRSCGADTYCAGTILGGTTCYQTCRTTADCGDEATGCSTAFPGSGFFSLPSCWAKVAECGPDELGDLFTGECFQTCLADADCPTGRVCADYACVLPCDTDCDCGPSGLCGPWGGCSTATTCKVACDPDATCVSLLGDSSAFCEIPEDRCVTP